MRRAMIDKDDPHFSVVRQCKLLGLHRSGLYYRPCPESEENLAILRFMDEQYLRTPFFGVRRLRAWLKRDGYRINRKRIRRLMEVWGWQTIYRRPRTTIAQPGVYKYPYLLKDLIINRVNQERWADGYKHMFPMRRGYMYLCITNHRFAEPLCYQLEREQYNDGRMVPPGGGRCH